MTEREAERVEEREAKRVEDRQAERRRERVTERQTDRDRQTDGSYYTVPLHIGTSDSCINYL